MKKLIQLSEKQIEANRRNAKKARGPITPGGKRISSQNAVTHGLLAKAVLLPGESVANFNALHASYINQFLPATQEEQDLIETIAVSRWRIRRAWTLEAANIAIELQTQSEALSGKDPAAKAAMARRALDEQPKPQDSLSRYEQRCHRAYIQSLDRLHRIQAEKRENVQTNPQLQLNTTQSLAEHPIRTVNEPPTNPDQTPNEPANPGHAT